MLATTIQQARRLRGYDSLVLSMGPTWYGVPTPAGLRDLGPLSVDAVNELTWDSSPNDRQMTGEDFLPRGWPFPDGALTAPPHASLSGFGDFAVGLWLRVVRLAGSSIIRHIWGVDNQSSQRSWAIAHAPAGLPLESRRIDLLLSPNGTTLERLEGICLVEQLATPAVGMRFLVVTRSGSTITTYIDGAEISTKTYANTLHTSTADMRFGRVSGAALDANGTATGVLAMQRPFVFRRSLSADEITALYLAGRNGTR